MSQLFFAAEISATKPGSAVFTYSQGHGTTAHGTMAPYPDPLAATTTLTVSDVGYRTSAATDGDPVAYLPLISEAFAIDRKVNLEPSSPGIAAAWGSLLLNNASGQFDGLVAAWTNDARPVNIYYGAKTVEAFGGLQSNRTTIGTYIDANHVMQAAAAGVVRNDYTSGTAVILNEPAATNVLLNSDSQSALQNPGEASMATSTAVASLYAPATIKLCTVTAASGNRVIGFFSFQGAAATVYTVSIWIWVPTGSTVGSIAFGAESGGTANTNIVLGSTSKRDQWQRVSFFYTHTSGSVAANLVLRFNTTVTGATCYVTCPQVEAFVAAPTSYISTAATAVTRAADNNYAARGIMLDPAYSALLPIFKGVQEPWVLQDQKFQVSLRDASYWMDHPLQTNQYLGSGTYQGTAALTGTLMPMARGGTAINPIRNVTPVLIDPVNLIYQFNDAPGTVVNLYEGGALTIVFSADSTNLFAGSTAAGRFRTDNSRGLFQLGSSPAAAITADVTGQFPTAGAQTTLINIARYLLTETLGLPPAYINLASFAAANTAYPYTGGIYFSPSDSPSGLDAVNRVLTGMGAKLYPGRDGQLRILVLRAPSGTSLAQFDTTNTVSVVPVALPSTINPPPYRMRVARDHNYTVQTSGLLGSITAAQRQYVAQADLYGSASSSTVLANYYRPNDLAPVTGALLGTTDAPTVASDLMALWGVRRRLYTVTVPVALGLLRDIGDLITLKWPMDDLAAGQLGMVVGEAFRSADASITLTVLV